MVASREGELSRGRLVARVLAGSWREEGSASDITEEEFRPISPVLERHASAGLAWRRIRDTRLAHLSEAARLKNAFHHYTLQARLMERYLLEALTYFKSHGVEPVLGKGWAVGRHYPEPGCRPYGDLDLWVPPPHFRAAKAALEDPKRPVVPIELHEGFKQLADQDPEGMARRTRIALLNGVEVRVFAPEDHLRLVALHALRHGLSRPLWLCDVAVLLENLPSDFDWGLAMKGDPWYSEGVRCALGLARELLGVDLEAAGVPAPWRAPPLPSWMVPAALSAFGAEAHYMDAGTLDPGSLLLRPRDLLRVARLRWANPLEATSRRKASWDESARFPVQLADYLIRSAGFLRETPEYLRFLWETRHEDV